ncbi:MAG: GNAT family N-acetyltransferase, partial [Rickettsiales bacterium]|nr:GNAT family N-acetyltransferase [Rickettsiales bacterium]
MENFPEILKGGALELRRLPVTFENAKRVFDIVDRNREHLGRWLTWVDRIKTAEDEYDGLKCVSANEWNYFIFDGERLAGSAGFGDRDEKTKSLEIGYWLDKESTGKGIMTRAVGMLENAAFSAGWNLIRIRCDALNAASQNVPKRLG